MTDEELLLRDLWSWSELVPPSPDPGLTYTTVAALLLDVGRLFTPQPWPGGGPPPGEIGRCYVEAASWAWGTDGLAYVEGVMWQTAMPIEHAWCAEIATGRMLDTVLPADRLGGAYIGVPIRADAAADLMGRHGGPLLAHATPVTREWMTHGVPAELLVDVGRPVPRAATASPSHVPQ